MAIQEPAASSRNLFHLNSSSISIFPLERCCTTLKTMTRAEDPRRNSRLTLAAVLLLLCIFAPHLCRSSPHPSRARHSHTKHLTSPETRSFADLNRRDTYSCDADNPCSNGACCGPSGYCGYGPIYCGTGCVSNCNTTAQCGQYAATPGATWPLNVCCSQYGFVSLPSWPFLEVAS